MGECAAGGADGGRGQRGCGPGAGVGIGGGGVVSASQERAAARGENLSQLFRRPEIRGMRYQNKAASVFDTALFSLVCCLQGAYLPPAGRHHDGHCQLHADVEAGSAEF